VITNQFNFKNIDTPFGDHDLTLQNLKSKKQHHLEQLRLERKEIQAQQLKDFEVKKKIYKKYNDE
jgi:predicted N-acyltransferase